MAENEYPPEWLSGAIPKRIKDAALWRCVRCGHPHDTGGVVACDDQCDHARHSKGVHRMLTVHHLDGDKANVQWWNLTALCQGCHLSIQARVKMPRIWMLPHSEWFQPYVAAYYASLQGLPTDRPYVMGNLEALLTLPVSFTPTTPNTSP